MANSYLTASFEIEAPENELDLLAEAIASFDAIIDETAFSPSDALIAAFSPKTVDPSKLFEDTIPGAAATLCVTVERDSPDKMSIYGEQHVSVDELGELIRRCCPTALPFGFTFSVHSDKPHAGSSFGGYILVTESGVTGKNSDTEVASLMRQLKADQPIDQLMRDAIGAYDDDGMLTEQILGNGIGFLEAKHLILNGVVGDTLPLFILGEMSDARGDYQAAADMMERAAEDLQKIADALRTKV